MRVYDECAIKDERFAILVNDETKEAFEAVWDGEGWNTDFSYPSIEVDADEAYDSLDFDGCRDAGFKFIA